MKQRFLLLTVLCGILMSTQCDTDTVTSQEDDQKELAALKATIENLAARSVCNENTECKSIALGSKPCGGPWTYLIYSSSIDVEKLESLVKNYNAKERIYNDKWAIASDCMLVSPPSSLTCENNTCIAVY